MPAPSYDRALMQDTVRLYFANDWRPKAAIAWAMLNLPDGDYAVRYNIVADCAVFAPIALMGVPVPATH